MNSATRYKHPALLAITVLGLNCLNPGIAAFADNEPAPPPPPVLTAEELVNNNSSLEDSFFTYLEDRENHVVEANNIANGNASPAQRTSGQDSSYDNQFISYRLDEIMMEAYPEEDELTIINPVMTSEITDYAEDPSDGNVTVTVKVSFAWEHVFAYENETRPAGLSDSYTLVYQPVGAEYELISEELVLPDYSLPSDFEPNEEPVDTEDLAPEPFNLCDTNSGCEEPVIDEPDVPEQDPNNPNPVPIDPDDEPTDPTDPDPTDPPNCDGAIGCDEDGNPLNARGAPHARYSQPRVNVKNMVKYALKWTDGRGDNPNYRSLDSDCTNFASQALFAGGWNEHNGGTIDNKDTWDHDYGVPSRISPTWSVADKFYTYVDKHGYYDPEDGIWEGRKGDLIFADWSRASDDKKVPDGILDHVMIVTGTDKGKPTITQKSIDRRDIPLSRSVKIAREQGFTNIKWKRLDRIS